MLPLKRLEYQYHSLTAEIVPTLARMDTKSIHIE